MKEVLKIPKNNFEEYGFTADFEGEIKFVDNYNCYVGIVEHHKNMNSNTNNSQTCFWDSNGYCYVILKSDVDRCYERDLTPIKKPWYEDYSNFPCLVVYDEKEIKLMRSYKETDKHRKEPCLLTADGSVYHSLDKCRPATKEEVLSLLVKE